MMVMYVLRYLRSSPQGLGSKNIQLLALAEKFNMPEGPTANTHPKRNPWTRILELVWGLGWVVSAAIPSRNMEAAFDNSGAGIFALLWRL